MNLSNSYTINRWYLKTAIFPMIISFVILGSGLISNIYYYASQTEKNNQNILYSNSQIISQLLFTKDINLLEKIMLDLSVQFKTNEVAICKDGKTIITQNFKNSKCPETILFFEKLYRYEILGHDNLYLILKINLFKLNQHILLQIGVFIFIIVFAFYTLLKINKNIRSDLLTPLESSFVEQNYLLNIKELIDLKRTVTEINYIANQKEQELVKNAAVNQLAKQVAHDIRSPLSVLNLVISSLDKISPDKKELIASCALRINEIANDLLDCTKKKTNDTLLQNHSNFALISSEIERLLAEKKLFFSSKDALNISSRISTKNLFMTLSKSDLNRVLSNLINNSVEAIGDSPGNVEVSLTSDDHNAIINISDNGPGIPPHILAKLGVESISYGKENTDSGSGIGVLHAKKTIENMNGKFSILSSIGKGTTVTITLPLSEKPVWFLEKLYLKPNSTVLVCDDDASIIALWKKRFSEYDKVNINYFSSLNSLKEFLDSTQTTDFTLLTDYEFSGENQTGLDFIIENNLASKSILVTSHYDEPDVIQKCIDHNIKQIPKNICALVPIEMASSKEYYDAVVLDNEDLQVRSWQFAAIQKGKNILTFSNSDEFLSALSNIDYQTPIFIDSILDSDIKGEDIAKKINELGFKNIYMSSGHDPSHFSDMTFLKGVISKTPFFP